MIGPKIGAKIGARIGARVGLVRGASDPLANVPLDASSSKYVPLTQADWDGVFEAAGMSSQTVAHSWGFQDASGNIAATVGTDLTVTVSGTAVDYQQAVAGWTRTAVKWGDGANVRAAHAAGVGANPATGSVLWIGYIAITATPASNRLVLSPSMNGTPAWNGTVNSTPVYRALINSVQTLGASDPGTTVRPVVVLHDRTGSRANMYTDQDKIVGTYAEVGDGIKGFGSSGASAGPMATLWGACFSGADAEWTNAQIKTVLETLGWSPAWTP